MFVLFLVLVLCISLPGLTMCVQACVPASPVRVSSSWKSHQVRMASRTFALGLVHQPRLEYLRAKRLQVCDDRDFPALVY